MDKNEVIFKAFEKACKYLRDHPPADAGWEGDTEVLGLIVDAESDPEGARWGCYFINQVLDEAGIQGKGNLMERFINDDIRVNAHRTAAAISEDEFKQKLCNAVLSHCGQRDYDEMIEYAMDEPDENDPLPWGPCR